MQELFKISNEVLPKERMEKVIEEEDPCLPFLEEMGKQFLALHRFLEERNFSFPEDHHSNVNLFVTTLALRIASLFSGANDLRSLADMGREALDRVLLAELLEERVQKTRASAGTGAEGKKNVSQAAL